MAKKSILSPALMRQLLTYVPSDGLLFWNPRNSSIFRNGNVPADQSCKRWNTRYAGKEAFTCVTRDGYRVGKILGRVLLAHRVVWAMENNQWPEKDIDHINGVRDDNRLINLRQATNKENAKNAALPRNNTSGDIGVGWHKRDQIWQSYIGVDGKSVHLGYFLNKSDAIGARAYAEKRYGFHKNHGRASR